MTQNDYIQFISEVRESILQSRYKAASLANREMLLLYYETGKRLSEKILSSNWGAKVIRSIADDLQKELPGLRGFSYRNLMKMKQFFDEYPFVPLSTAQFESKKFGQLSTGQIRQLPTAEFQSKEFVPLITAQIGEAEKVIDMKNFVENTFLKIGFTHHILLINKCKDLKERLFYFQKIIENQWSINILEHHINSQLYQLKGKMISNFERSLPVKMQKHATDAFKSEYLLDFINISEEDDERVLESEIVKNIKTFIMSLGNDFSFLGNQYRLIVGGEEFFVDLLFFHRTLQSLIAFELKNGKFKPEFAGKMNFYLSALDEYVKKEHENPSIGIILCKEKNDTVIEFAFKDYNKAMGVAAYKTSRNIPDKFKGLLPNAEELKKLF